MFVETYIDLQQHANSTASLAADAQQQQHQASSSTARAGSSSSRRGPAADGKQNGDSSRRVQPGSIPEGTHHAPVRTNSETRLRHDTSAAGSAGCGRSADRSSSQVPPAQLQACDAAAGHARSSHHSRAPSSPAALHSSAINAAAAGRDSSLRQPLPQPSTAAAVATAAAGLRQETTAELGDAEDAADNAMHAAVASTLMVEQGASSRKVSLQCTATSCSCAVPSVEARI